ncbi:MAG TPA: Hsp33 family molecular chaperone HslO [Thermoanaerobaculia bacterium]|nr:Hsp33 family molecular chaperone HslO [Thermoanaerobaculia bacterium]
MREDRLIQGMAAGGDFRIIAAQTTITVETARRRHDLSPVGADALGRAMTAAVMLARLLEKTLRNQRVTLRFDGGGPLGVVIAEGTGHGAVRGYVGNPHIGSDAREVGDAIGFHGRLTVVRGTPPLGKPYTSQIELVSGEVAKDIAQYLATSEQIAAAVVLGVLSRPAGVAAAGGMIIQAFPHTSERAIAGLEERIRDAAPFSTLLDRMRIEEAVEVVLEDLDYKAIDSRFDVPIHYRCSCTADRALAQLSLLEPYELREMIENEGGSEVVCQFCGAKYNFTPQEILTLTAPPDA